MIVTEGKGALLAESVTTPETVLCADADTLHNKSGRRKLKNRRLRFIMMLDFLRISIYKEDLK